MATDIPFRAFLKADLWREWERLESDQRKQIPPPPIEKPIPPDARQIALVAPEDFTLGTMPLIEAIRRRRSRRSFTAVPLTLEELSFLLWATQGVSRTQSGAPLQRGAAVLRTVPSGGARHPFETYVAARDVTGLAAGLYRYLPLEHTLCFLQEYEIVRPRLALAARQQRMIAEAPVVFIWTAIPYRTEWRYNIVAPKIIAQDSGHLCENLYLACEAIGAGTCAVGAYDQEATDAVVEVDGEDEFVVYLAPVGKCPPDLLS